MGSFDKPVFILPIDCRPEYREAHNVVAWDNGSLVVGICCILTNGNVIAFAGEYQDLDLDGITFRARATLVNAYITNSGDNTVSVINTATNTVTATVPVGTGPYGVAVTPDGKKVYVMCPEDDCGAIDPGSFYVIGTSTNTVIATVPLGGVGGGPVGVAVSPDGTKAYATTYAGVTVIDTATNTVTAGFGPGFMLRGVAFNPAGTKAYTASLDYPGDVRVIDTATNTVTGLSLAMDSYFAVAVSPDGTKVYVTNDVSVIVIDTATNTVTATVSVGSSPNGIAVTPDGTRVYAANYASNTTSVIDTATNTVTATVPVGRNPHGVVVTPDGKKVYVANRGSNTVSVIDTATNTVTATVPVGKGPIAFGQFIGTIQKPGVSVTTTLTAAKDNRLREASPETVSQEMPYIDVGGTSAGRSRDVMLFDLNGYTANKEIIRATLSLFWYYPEGKSRPEDTIIEIYRPDSWNSDYVSWNSRDNGVMWVNAGGDWYDKNGVSQGSAPYATITLKGSDIPDNRYYELDVTDLVREYASGKYANAGFLIKARTESNNYIAFYSSDCGNEDQFPRLKIEHTL